MPHTAHRNNKNRQGKCQRSPKLTAQLLALLLFLPTFLEALCRDLLHQVHSTNGTVPRMVVGLISLAAHRTVIHPCPLLVRNLRLSSRSSFFQRSYQGVMSTLQGGFKCFKRHMLAHLHYSGFLLSIGHDLANTLYSLQTLFDGHLATATTHALYIIGVCHHVSLF